MTARERAREKAFRQFLREMGRYLSLPRLAQIREKDAAYLSLRRHGSKAHDPNAYLFRIARAFTYEGQHRSERTKTS